MPQANHDSARKPEAWPLAAPILPAINWPESGPYSINRVVAGGAWGGLEPTAGPQLTLS